MTAATIDELTLSGEPACWAALGFNVADGAIVLGAVTVRFAEPRDGRGILGWSLRDLASTALDGLPTTRSQQAAGRVARDARVAEHANGVTAIDHIVAISPDLERTVAALQTAGLDLRRIREEPTPAGAPRQAFFRIGAEVLEVIQEPDEAVARGGGPDHPARFWGLALLTEDLERTLAAFGPHVGSIRAAVQPGRRIATVGRTAGLSVPVALMSRDEGTSRDGARWAAARERVDPKIVSSSSERAGSAGHHPAVKLACDRRGRPTTKGRTSPPIPLLRPKSHRSWGPVARDRQPRPASSAAS
jgi:hypothetical protein